MWASMVDKSALATKYIFYKYGFCDLNKIYFTNLTDNYYKHGHLQNYMYRK